MNCTNQSDKVKKMNTLLKEKLDHAFPIKTFKVSTHDKPFMTRELKEIDRKKRREYFKNGKSQKYICIKKEYDRKMKKASTEYLKRNVSLLKQTNPRKAYKILKQMGAPPGENKEDGMFSLSSHVADNLTPQESVNRIADHFTKISKEYPSLELTLLPEEIKERIRHIKPEDIPYISRWTIENTIRKTKIPHSTVPHDIPSRLTKEFAHELSVPLSVIF